MTSHSVIDMHFHVGLMGDHWPHFGGISTKMTENPAMKVFLLYTGLDRNDLTDPKMRRSTVEVLAETTVDHVVCLALDPFFDNAGVRRPLESHMWVANEYVLELREEVGDKVLLGASVHPYDPAYSERLRWCVDEGAVLMKWLPSAQGIDLADPRCAAAITQLADAGPGGRPVPLLLHVGPEYAVLPVEDRLKSYDFLCWTAMDRLRNALAGRRKLLVPKIEQVRRNLEHALDRGAVIILAHCGLPYVASGPLGRLFEHSDFKIVKKYLSRYPAGGESGGKCFADVSALCTPFRRPYFKALERLDSESLLFGSDFPTPVFELDADLHEAVRDFKAILRGEIERIVVPQDNLVDVNHSVLKHFFGDHPLFTNFSRLLM